MNNFRTQQGLNADSLTLGSGIEFASDIVLVGQALDGRGDVHYRARGVQLTSFEGSAAVETFHTLSGTATAKSVEIVSHAEAMEGLTANYQEPLIPIHAYYMADAGATVASVPDKGSAAEGNSLAQATLASQPILTTFGPNELPAFKFDGIDDRLIDTFPTIEVGKGFSVMLAVRFDEPLTGLRYVLFLGAITASPLFGTDATGAPIYVIGDSVLNTFRPDTEDHILVITSAGNVSGDGLLYRDDAIDTPLSVFSSQDWDNVENGFSIGGSVAPVSFAAATVAEFEVFDRLLTEVEVRALMKNKTAKYGL